MERMAKLKAKASAGVEVTEVDVERTGMEWTGLDWSGLE